VAESSLNLRNKPLEIRPTNDGTAALGCTRKPTHTAKVVDTLRLAPEDRRGLRHAQQLAFVTSKGPEATLLEPLHQSVGNTLDELLEQDSNRRG